MKKFVVLYHAPIGAAEQMAKSSEEDMKKGMEPWMQWAEKCGSNLLDMGNPLANAKVVTKEGASPSSSTVVGYSMLQAETEEQALGMLKGHPHLDWVNGCQVELHEVMPLPGM